MKKKDQYGDCNLCLICVKIIQKTIFNIHHVSERGQKNKQGGY